MTETFVNYQQILKDDVALDDMFDDDVEGSETVEEDANNNNSSKRKDAKNKKKRNRKKKSVQSASMHTNGDKNGQHYDSSSDTNKENNEEIEIELVPEEIKLDAGYAEFSRIFDHFKFGDSPAVTVVADAKKAPEVKTQGSNKAAELERLQRLFEDEEEEKQDELNAKDESGQPKMSKKKLKKLTRLSVAALKQLVNKPDVVEMHDVTALDPKLLVSLKATKNTIPVPRHWCAKRTYLQGKRGFEKPAFDLPDFIKRTGIQSMREAVQEKDANKSLKQKMREKVRPKMGKIDIDYQKLHDAFFRYQTKPRMSIHGDLYYEGKEMETRLKEKKPGNYTDDLRIALGMPIGANADKVPPPWLIAMQRYGPPPSYPSLKIPGLNAPIPDGCSFGYHAGGWGKPPVDEYGRPLYGDVFGSTQSDLRKPEEEEPVDLTLWGELEDEVYEEVMPGEDSDEEEEADADKDKENEAGEEEEEDEAGDDDTAAGLKTPGEGLMTPSGISTTVSAGLETPDMIELRKRKTQIESDMESMSGGDTPALYKILPERAAAIGASMMGSSKVYDLTKVKKSGMVDLASGFSSSATGIDMALNPDELDMASDALQSRLDEQLRQIDNADLEDLEKQQQKKRNKSKAPAPPTSASTTSSTDKDKNKKYKEFKF